MALSEYLRRLPRVRPTTLLFATVVLIVLIFSSGIQTPFEWDEILFARAVEHYDAASNSPHMPGYPVFVVATRVVALAVGDPVRAVQLTSQISALLLLVLLISAARHLGHDIRQGILAAGLVALTPCFLWFSGTGLSDVAGGLFGLAVFVAILRGRDSLNWAILSGILAGMAIGVRTQAVYVLLPLGVVALIEWRHRILLRISSAATAAFLTSLAVWTPAVLLTGRSRWWAAFRWQLEWVSQERANGLALPFAPLNWILQGWLIRPFGNAWLAALFWISVAFGTTVAWRKGRLRPALYCLGVGTTSLFFATFSLDLRNGPRYILPSLVFFCLLIAGGADRTNRAGRLLVGGMALFMAGSVAWIFPAVALRRAEPAPVMSVLERIRDQYDPDSTVVFYEAKIWPHTEWILGRSGFEIIPMAEFEAWSESSRQEPRTAVAVHSNRGKIPEDALFRASWHDPRQRPMIPGRYLRCWAVEKGPTSPIYDPGSLTPPTQVQCQDPKAWIVKPRASGDGRARSVND